MKNYSLKLVPYLGLLFIFLSLILFNQQKAQKEILSSKIPNYSIVLSKNPTSASVNELVEFAWDVNAPNTATTTLTTIYYGFTSSPSALTSKDSPQAVGYPYKLFDYLSGRFSLPDTFSARSSFLPGTIYYRAYSLVGNQHLWSDEIKLLVKQ